MSRDSAKPEIMRFRDGNFKKEKLDLKNFEIPEIVKIKSASQVTDPVGLSSIDTLLLEFKNKISNRLKDII